MLRICNSIWIFAQNFLIKYCAKEYQLKLESYYYSDKTQTYVLTFRVRTKPIIQTVFIQNAFYDKDLLMLMHPIDAYIMGIIYGMYRNMVIIKTNIMSYFKDYGSYHIVEPSLFIVSQPLNDNDHIILKTKHGSKSFKIPISELYKKSFLLHAIGSSAASQLGFFISEKFILEIN